MYKDIQQQTCTRRNDIILCVVIYLFYSQVKQVIYLFYSFTCFTHWYDILISVNINKNLFT